MDFKRVKHVVTAVALGAALVGGSVGAAPTNWGQAVKECNQTSCYPDGTSRGVYVSGQANDSQTPGYAWEIHNLANPGNSDPTLP